MGREKNVTYFRMFLFDCFAERLKLISILICFDFLLDLLLSCRETASVFFQFLSLLVSLLSEDQETEHGKFIDCKLFVSYSVGCTYSV